MLGLLACVGAARGGELPVSPQALRGVDASALAYTYAIGSFVPEYTPPAPGTGHRKPDTQDVRSLA